MGIKQIGIELEGMWNHCPDGFTYDGSVSIPRVTGNEYVGEVPSPPLAPDAVAPWLDANYPDTVNHTCGIHVHISFDTKTEYSLLMSHAAKLEHDLIQAVHNWATEKEIISGHPLWARLRGENRYCRTGVENVNIQTRARGKVNARYRMLNFCYSLHGTLEIRMLPGFKRKHLGIGAVLTVIATVQNALDNYDKLPKILIRETPVGRIECHAWKQGFTCSLDTSEQMKRELYLAIYGRYKQQSMLARLLKRSRVTIPVITLEALEVQLSDAASALGHYRITLTREES